MKKLQPTLEILALGVLLGFSPGFNAFAGGGEATNASCGVPTFASLSGGEQHDYPFAVQERSTVSVTWSLRSGSVSLDILDESGDLIVCADESGVATFEAEPGTYFLRFRAGADSSSYRFEVLLLKSSSDCVAAVTCGLPAMDTLNAGEQQGYSFALPERGTVSVTWSLRSGSASLDVLEENGDPIVAGEESGLATFEAEPGTYFLRFRAGADSSSYRFEVLFLKNSPDCVAAVTCGLPVMDTLNAGEQQGYSFALPERGTVSVTWSLRSGSVSLDVLEENGDLIVANEESGLATFEAEPGTYFLRFRAGADGSSYRSEVVFLSSSLGCAGSVACGLPVLDTIGAGEQNDYSFALQERNPVSVTWSLRSGSVSLDVLEESGQVILADESGLAAFEAEPGRYFLRFRAGADSSSYEFAVTGVPLASGSHRIPGDCNRDCKFDASDGICLLGFLFLGNPERLPCGNGSVEDLGNVNLLDWEASAVVDISDAICMFSFLFNGGPPHTLVDSGFPGVPVKIPGCP